MVETLPEGLADVPPGPELAAVLATIDRTLLRGSDTVTLLQNRARQLAHDQAELLADILEVGLTDWDSPADRVARMTAPDEFSRDQVAWALRWSLPFAQSQLDLAADLTQRLPAVFAALEAGEIDHHRASVFHDVLAGVRDEVARTVADELLEHASDWTATQLRERLRRTLHRRDPAHVKRRYQRGVVDRSVHAGVTTDGTGYLTAAGLPVDRTAAANDYLNRLARAAKASGDVRTLEQLRTDACLDLLAGVPFRLYPSCDPVTAEADGIVRAEALASGAKWNTVRTPSPTTDRSASSSDARVCCSCGGVRPADRRGTVTLTMKLTTLIGLNDDPALTPLWGPVLADIARQIALDPDNPTTWQYAVTDEHGAVRHRGITRRRPPAVDLHAARLRDQTCRAPHCQKPAHRCDADHRHDWSKGGCSDVTNLEMLCRHHHRLKHHKRVSIEWHVDGARTWHAPNGRRYHVPADDTLAWLAIDDEWPRRQRSARAARRARRR